MGLGQLQLQRVRRENGWMNGGATVLVGRLVSLFLRPHGRTLLPATPWLWFWFDHRFGVFGACTAQNSGRMGRPRRVEGQTHAAFGCGGGGAGGGAGAGLVVSPPHALSFHPNTVVGGFRGATQHCVASSVQTARVPWKGQLQYPERKARCRGGSGADKHQPAPTPHAARPLGLPQAVHRKGCTVAMLPPAGDRGERGRAG